MPANLMPFLPPFLLILSNLFMTAAWYGHLKFPGKALWLAILVSWGIALIEYCLAVPANRIGYRYYSAAELKTMQEIITICVFIGFSVFYLNEKFTVQHLAGFALMIAGAWFIFHAPKA